MDTWKQNLEETKRHYINWWNHKGIVLNMWEHFQEGVTPHADIPAPKPYKDLNQRWFDPQWRAEYLDWYVAHSSLMADMLPVANTQLGPGSLAAILGGVFEGGEDTIWIHPRPTVVNGSPIDIDEIKFDPNHPNWLLHKELLKACKQKAQGHYYVGMPDLMEGLDVLAAIKGTDKVLLDTVMQPEVLEHQMQQINDIYFLVFDELYDIIREGDEMAFCYFSSWAPGKMSKLQSDISTMISVDDYRRFVQPFIREQCQKIDYTLYHLDGVGAMHHLDALLEIKELNAIQWTPGVGEPQGGSPKWYDLYKKILAAGKSIMACWVTLDELRPLLDNIGGDGVHIEMDFHNEQEVEQALKIVDEFQHSRNATPHFDQWVKNLHSASSEHTIAGSSPADEADREVEAIIQKIEGSCGSKCTCGIDHDHQYAVPDIGSLSVNTPSKPTLEEAARQRILIFDGAMGTSIQALHLTNTRGCNEYLCIECPEVISEIYRQFLAAGSDVITTNTFNAQSISLKALSLEHETRHINIVAAQLARQLADAFTLAHPEKPRYVLGGMGPTRETVSMEGAKISYDELRAVYQEQAEALLEGGVDGLLLETIFDAVNAQAGIEACQQAMKKMQREVPLLLSYTVRTPEGFNMIGQNVIETIKQLPADGIFAVGLNCSPDINMILQLTRRLATETKQRIIVFPNAGLPDEHNHYPTTPQMFQREMWPFFNEHLVNIVGGCCGTTHEHMAALVPLAQPAPGCFVTPHIPGTMPTDRVLGSSAAEASISTSASTPVAVPTTSPVTTPEGAPEGIEERLFQSILNGKSDDAAAATKEAIAQNIAPQDLINGQMIRAMGEVGQRFQDGKAFVPQLLMAGRAMKAALELLKPMMAGSASTSIGKVVIGTVKGDLHDIGKNLVASMLEGCGFEVVNIGIDVSADTFIKAIKENQPDILCMSALLTTTMGYMKEVIDALETAGIRDQVKVMVGGAPVTQGFADEIGADGYSDNANSAVTVAKQLLGKL